MSHLNGRGFRRSAGGRAASNRVANRLPTYEAKQEWRLWTTVTLECAGLPRGTRVEDLYEMFSAHGSLSAIQILGEGNAVVSFSPPPSEAFWYKVNVGVLGPEWRSFRITLQPARNLFKHRSPVNPEKFYDEHVVSHIPSMCSSKMNSDKPRNLLLHHSTLASWRKKTR